MQDPWGRKLEADEIATVRRLAELTGLPAGQIVRHANYSRLEQAKFRIVVALATTTLEVPPDMTKPPDWQEQGIAEYAASLIDFEP